MTKLFYLKLVLISFVFLLTSCNLGFKYKPTKVDSVLVPYWEEFKNEMNSRNVDAETDGLVIKVDKTTQDSYNAEAIGRLVVFNEDKFNNFSDGHIRYLMFHELGHAMFGFPHSNNPYSIKAGGGVSINGSLLLSEKSRIDEFFGISSIIIDSSSK